MPKRPKGTDLIPAGSGSYGVLVSSIAKLLGQARRSTVRTVNGILTATYWEIGQRIVEFEQGGKARAAYGDELLKRLGVDLSARLGRGFSDRNLRQMRSFYQGWEIWQTPSAKFEARAICPGLTDDSTAQTTQPNIWQTVSAKSRQAILNAAFPLSWSHYVRLMSVEKPHARVFYESEAIRGGWSVRQLDRQISTRFFERSAHAKQQAPLKTRDRKAGRDAAVSVEDEVRDPYLLEFLNLKDEYSESELEEALIQHLESFLLELGAGFTFVARQKRIRIGQTWYRIDLLLFHRILRCLVVIDLKTGEFNHADAGQMNLYLNYIRQHLKLADEADPVGIILCTGKDDAVVEYAMGGISARVFASQYLTQLPNEETLRREIQATKRALTYRAAAKAKGK